MAVLLVVLLLAVSAHGAANLNEVVPFKYPLFKQCDPRWGSDVIETQTVCAVGCLMSSISMVCGVINCFRYGVDSTGSQALNGKNITIDKQASNPGVLNSWLKQNNGYNQDNDLSEEVIYNIAPTRIKYIGPLFNNTAIAPKTLKQMLQKEGVIVIANVDAGHHFVLVVGYDSGETNWYVNDPGFERNSYTYADIVGYRIFQML